MFELQIINPATYKPHNLRLFRNVTNISTTKAYNDIGSFGFSVKADLVEFEEAINTPDGQGQVMVYAEGKPYIHGVISSYKPTGTGFIEVECSEILQLLKDDIALGELQFSNWLAQYTPEDSPEADASFDSKLAYWGNGGMSFFASDIFEYLTYSNTPGGPPTINRTVLSVESATGGLKRLIQRDSALPILYPRLMINNHLPEFNIKMQGRGLLDVFYFLGTHSYDYKIANQSTSQHLDKGIYLAVRSLNMVELIFNLDLCYRYGDTEVILNTTVINSASIAERTSMQITPYNLAITSDIDFTFSYKEEGNNIKVGYELEFKYMGEVIVYGIPEAVIAKPSDISMYNSQGHFGQNYDTYVYGYNLDKPIKDTLFDWLVYSSPDIRFEKGDNSGVMDYFSWKLSFNNSDRWQIVKRILEFAESPTLQYDGIKEGKPSYKIFSYETIPTVYKFADGDDIFNVSYQKDFSDTYNVLTTSVNKSSTVAGRTVEEVYNITIAPTPERPNRLGRLIRRIVSPSGIEDISTLTQWALAVYEEHSYPEEPIDFESYASSFWLDCKLGQYVTIHGLLQGKTITEQVNKISIDSSTGVASIELAKRITLKSALIEARLAGQ